jgi:putative ABC transport system permease protein
MRNWKGLVRARLNSLPIDPARAGDIAAAQAEVDALTAQLQTAYPDTNKGWRVRLAGIQDVTVGEAKSALVVLAGAVGLVLLIACANVASLLLARATSRRRETSIRFALGASRGRVAAQWLTENMVLSLAGAVAGVALAYGVVRLVVAFGPGGVPRLDETTVDMPVLAVTFLVAMVAGALPALVPAVRMLRRASHPSLTSGVAGGSPLDRSTAGAALIVCEVALAMALAVAGALLFKSFARLTAVMTGRALSTLLFNVEPFDLPTIGAVALLVLVTGIAAACIPARRASALDPVDVLRS